MMDAKFNIKRKIYEIENIIKEYIVHEFDKITNKTSHVDIFFLKEQFYFTRYLNEYNKYKFNDKSTTEIETKIYKFIDFF